MASLQTRKQIQAHLRNVLQRNNEADIPEDQNKKQGAEEKNDTEEDSASTPLNITEDDTDSGNDEPSQLPRAPARRLRAPFPRAGKVVFQNTNIKVIVNEIAHKQFSRFNVGDHLYSINFEIKQGQKIPYVLDIEEALEKGMMQVLEHLKASYDKQEDFQIYATIIGRGIKSGINTGNYSLRTPSDKIVRWMLSMLYNYLKSNQTMKLNSSFHIKIKVLSVEHTNDLEKRKRTFRKHVIGH